MQEEDFGSIRVEKALIDDLAKLKAELRKKFGKWQDWTETLRFCYIAAQREMSKEETPSDEVTEQA
jgi:hypothetical protein